MKRLNALFGIFGIALVLPLSWLILQTYASLKQEEISQLRFFGTELFAQMEEDLSAKIYREESRPVDAYQPGPHSPLSDGATLSEKTAGSLAQPPPESYILGYFQNNPDGSFHSPYLSGKDDGTPDLAPLDRLKSINAVFNQKKYRLAEQAAPISRPTATAKEEAIAESFSTKYISQPSPQQQKSYLGRKKKRTEEITISQAVNLSQKTNEMEAALSMQTPKGQWAQELQDFEGDGNRALSKSLGLKSGGIPTDSEAPSLAPLQQEHKSNGLRVEVTPFQGVVINPETLFVFRRVILQNQVYRQGFALDLPAFIEHLAKAFFLSQPMARFAQLSFTLENGTQRNAMGRFGADIEKPEFNLAQAFPAPFDLLSVSLKCRKIPPSTARTTLNYIAATLCMVMLIGFFTIYRSVQSIVDLSQRRSRFVSSVTHELKTPLTNINLYIEMLAQGIARNKAKEQEYYQILSTESARLSRLIGNVLEFSRLEKKQRVFNLQKGDFSEVIDEVSSLFSAKLMQENYTLKINSNLTRSFAYDREVMIQVLINLIENSLKFGRDAKVRDIVITLNQTEGQSHIAVSDNGPGIPPKALKKVFDDFYRAEESDLHSIAGTGIGLALVKKFITAMGGRVKAENRPPGCKITISLPS